MKYIQLIFWVLLSYVFPYTASCQSAFQPGEVIINGRIEDMPEGSSNLIVLRFGDWVFVEREISFIQRLDTLSGYFNFQFNIFHPKEITLKYGEKSLRLFVSQGDSLHLTIKADDFYGRSSSKSFPSLRLEGTSAQINKDFLDYQHSDFTISSPPAIEEKGAAQYLKELEITYLEDQKKLRRYFDQNPSLRKISIVC